MTILEMSASGGVLIAAILLLRRGLLCRLPKWTFLLLWAVALGRLLIPFRLPSPVSVYTGAARVGQLIEAEAPVRLPAVSPPWTETPAAPLENLPPETAAPAVREASRPPELLLWGGTALCGLFFAAVYLRCLRRFRRAVLAEGAFFEHWQNVHPTLLPVRIMVCTGVRAPLACGLLRPAVLLPPDALGDEARLTYILTHEYVHIRRGDMGWKLLLTAAACLHWFNPLVWVMYFYANRDLELACDEAVVHILGPDSRKGYALALLQTEEERLLPLFSAYRSKSSLEERITAIMGTKKRTLGTVFAAVLLVAAVTALFATSRTPVPAGPSENARVWVDFYNEDSILWNESRELELPEFPGVTFTWTPSAVTAKTEEGEIVLFAGMPVYNVFLCDLTGDGLPELCATAAFGSGMVDLHVLVCDYAAAVQDSRQNTGEDIQILMGQAQYALWDRGKYDYILSLEGDHLQVTRAEYPFFPEKTTSGAVTGDLVLTPGGQLQIAKESDGTRPQVMLHDEEPTVQSRTKSTASGYSLWRAASPPPGWNILSTIRTGGAGWPMEWISC